MAVNLEQLQKWSDAGRYVDIVAYLGTQQTLTKAQAEKLAGDLLPLEYQSQVLERFEKAAQLVQAVGNPWAGGAMASTGAATGAKTAAPIGSVGALGWEIGTGGLVADINQWAALFQKNDPQSVEDRQNRVGGWLQEALLRVGDMQPRDPITLELRKAIRHGLAFQQLQSELAAATPGSPEHARAEQSLAQFAASLPAAVASLNAATGFASEKLAPPTTLPLVADGSSANAAVHGAALSSDPQTQSLLREIADESKRSREDANERMEKMAKRQQLTNRILACTLGVCLLGGSIVTGVLVKTSQDVSRASAEVETAAQNAEQLRQLLEEKLAQVDPAKFQEDMTVTAQGIMLRASERYLEEGGVVDTILYDLAARGHGMADQGDALIKDARGDYARWSGEVDATVQWWQGMRGKLDARERALGDAAMSRLSELQGAIAEGRGDAAKITKDLEGAIATFNEAITKTSGNANATLDNANAGITEARLMSNQVMTEMLLVIHSYDFSNVSAETKEAVRDLINESFNRLDTMSAARLEQIRDILREMRTAAQDLPANANQADQSVQQQIAGWQNDFHRVAPPPPGS